MKIRDTADAMARHRLPVDPWRLLETEHDGDDLGLTETLFGVGNGYIGMRANPAEGREAHTHGTYVNGFHETFPIQHAESAHAFAKTGQTIVNVPDAKLMKLYVDDEPLLLSDADTDSYQRGIDFRTGILWREIIWRTPAGKRIKVRTENMVSLTHRHLAVLRLEVTMLDASAPIVISSQLLNRQDGEDEYHVPSAALGEGRSDPRKARSFDRRVLIPTVQQHGAEIGSGGEVSLGYRCTESAMTLACAYRHELEVTGATSECRVQTTVNADKAKTVFSLSATPGTTLRLTKFVSYHSSKGVPAAELADRCHRTLSRAADMGVKALYADQKSWLDGFWERSDIEIEGDDAAQQAVRWNLFQLAQASAQTQEQGIAAKGITAGGYDGHYFWDTEVYVLPFLAYTDPVAARKLLRFRWKMLPAARARAEELSQRGALYPWRTINGEEASAYYAAGTAQYHINAAVAYALEQYVKASGDTEFLAHEGAEILVETARLWEDLGFFEQNGAERFHIHAVTGPDEYTTVVNDNFYTNVMARFNLRFATGVARDLQANDPEAYAALVRATGLVDSEIDGWERAATAMHLPYDEELGINPQDANFLDKKRWNFATTPAEKYPLLLNFHPLVIYRHQVLKQADVVLAMFLRGQRFEHDAKRRNFDYYDALTTGDSSLSACVQAIAAADVGHAELADDYFDQALYLDLANTHGNTADGVHVANAGGVWAGLVHGFAGMRHYDGVLQFAPKLPSGWESIRFRLCRHAALVEVTVDADGCQVTSLESGSGDVPVLVDDEVVSLAPGQSLRIPPAQ